MKPNDTHIVYGVTGGIGAGKSEILRYISAHYECRVLKADEVGRELMRKGRSVYKALVQGFGPEILLPDGEIDRAKLAEWIFSDPALQNKANEIEHPIIRDSIMRRIRRAKERPIFLEAALLKEGNLIPLCQEVIVVTADREVRVERLMASRGYTREKSLRVMDGQLQSEEFLRLADHVIDTGGSLPESCEKTRLLMTELGVPLKHDTV